MSLPITTSDIEVLGRGGDTDARVLTPDALAFVADLHRELDPIRRQLLAARADDGSGSPRASFPDCRKGRVTCETTPPGAWRPPLATCSTGASSSPDESIGRW
jgi:hypothetical protein